MGKRIFVLNSPVRGVYTTPANRYGFRPTAVRHENGKDISWCKGKYKRGVL